MKIKFKNVQKFQEGGAMPPQEEQMPPQEAQQGGGEDQLAQAAQQLVEMLMQQVGDPQAVSAILQMALEMVQSQGQQGQPEQPVYRKGGILAYKIK